MLFGAKFLENHFANFTDKFITKHIYFKVRRHWVKEKWEIFCYSITTTLNIRTITTLAQL